MWWKRRPAANDPPPVPAEPGRPPKNADALLRRLEWTVLRRLDGLVQGEHRTFMRGGGLDLADLREYQPHDDVRRIDWNVTARLQQPHVRLFLEDRDLVAWFVLALGMVAILVYEARDVGLQASQWFWLVVITILVAGACIWIVGWGDDDDEVMEEEVA